MIEKIKKYAVLLVAAAAFAAPVAWRFYEWTPQPFTPVDAADIVGPATAEVGEMVRLSVGEGLVTWKSLPDNPDIHVDGNQMFASFRKPGNYTVIAAVYKSGDLQIKSITISVGGAAPVAPVVPGPNTPNTPSATGGLAAKVKGWSAGTDKATAAKLAANFNTVVSEIEDGDLTDKDEIIARTAELNSSLNLKGFDSCMGQVQAFLTSESDAGRLTTPEQHLAVWREISNGFQAYSSG